MRKKIILSAAVIAAAYLGACGKPQFHCLVTGSPANLGVAPYWMKYLSSDNASAPCGQLTGEGIGMQEFNVPNTSAFSFAWRVDGIGALLAGGVPSTELDADPLNPSANGKGDLPSFPTNGICEASNFTAADQHFEDVLDDDGGVLMAATHITYNFSKLRFISNGNFPGTVFEGTVQLTQDDCTANYQAFAFWPEIGCATDVDCLPVALADPDAGHPSASGINPSLAQPGKPIVCNQDFGICELSFTKIDDVVNLQ